MIPSLTVPPLPQVCLSAFARSRSLSRSSGIPEIRVTPFPLRPFVSRETRTMPSPLGTDSFGQQTHLAIGLPQSGHILPCSVEYTIPGFISDLAPLTTVRGSGSIRLCRWRWQREPPKNEISDKHPSGAGHPGC